MVRRLAGVAAVGFLLTGAIAAKPAPASAEQKKVDLCHHEGNGSYHGISVSVNAEKAHRENHGDGRVGEAVPGKAGFTFDASCTPASNALVRAVSTDAQGQQRVIAELVDTNGDGVPSRGDTARTYAYPLTMEATSFGAFTVTEHVMDIAVEHIQFFTNQHYRMVNGASSSCQGCSFGWGDVLFESDTYPFHFQFYVESGTGPDGQPARTWFVDYDNNCISYCNRDELEINPGSPSRPTHTAVAVGGDSDGFLQVIWGF